MCHCLFSDSFFLEENLQARVKDMKQGNPSRDAEEPRASSLEALCEEKAMDCKVLTGGPTSRGRLDGIEL